MIEFISQPWPWYVGGPLITLTMILLLVTGKRFGVSSSFQTLCTLGGAGKVANYFKIDWKRNQWNLVFIAGSIVGGFLASQYLMDGKGITLSEATASNLSNLVNNPTGSMIPKGIFAWENILTLQGFVMLIVGGFLVGFGTRYAGGCTSGHAISGLSNLQLPSLIAVIGFFIGGLTIT